MNRLSGKAGRAQEHRRKQFVANFEVSTIFASCHYIFYTLYIFFICFAGTQEQEEGPVHSFETQIGPRFSRKLPTIVFVHHSSRKDQIKNHFQLPVLPSRGFGRNSDKQRQRNEETNRFCFCLFWKTTFFIELLIQ